MPQVCHEHCPAERGGLAAVAAGALALALGVLGAVLDQIVLALAAAAVVAVLGSLAVLVWVLRRERGTVTIPAAALPSRPPAAITATARPAIEARRVLPGVIITARDTAQR